MKGFDHKFYGKHEYQNKSNMLLIKSSASAKQTKKEFKQEMPWR